MEPGDSATVSVTAWATVPVLSPVLSNVLLALSLSRFSPHRFTSSSFSLIMYSSSCSVLFSRESATWSIKGERM